MPAPVFVTGLVPRIIELPVCNWVWLPDDTEIVTGAVRVESVSVGASVVLAPAPSRLVIAREWRLSKSPSNRTSRVIMKLTLVSPAATRSAIQRLTSIARVVAVPVAANWPMMSAVVPMPVTKFWLIVVRTAGRLTWLMLGAVDQVIPATVPLVACRQEVFVIPYTWQMMPAVAGSVAAGSRAVMLSVASATSVGSSDPIANFRYAAL